MQSSKMLGGLLIFVGVLGIVILGVDQVLRQFAPLHMYVLIIFVVIDMALGVRILAKPSKMVFMTAFGWSITRILAQFGDIFLAGNFQMSSGEFADYLFNPLHVAPPNPPGVPGALLDLILILQLLVAVLAWKWRSSAAK